MYVRLRERQMKMKNLDIEMHNTLDITNMTQKEIEDAIHAVLSGQKTFDQVAAESPGPKLTITEGDEDNV
jgi:MinD-like ATPase involved in chromosome partitioning or flagellar assembly